MAFLNMCFKIRKTRSRPSDDEIDHGNSCVRRYSWEEIQGFSQNFSKLIGTGGFSNVFLAQLPASTSAAVKVHVGSYRFNKVFKQELDICLRLCHDNIVKLLGYCDDRDDEGALVMEYVGNGSLEEKMRDSSVRLSWRRRMTIAFQLAQAVEYLHEKCSLQIVHGDIKASNILLDERLNCKLCDFGSAKMGFSSTVSASPSPSPSRTNKQLVMLGSPGYTDPHYLRTGLASKKNDIYSVGVILLELVTGMEAFSQERGGQGQLLTSMVAPLLKDIDVCEASKVTDMVDPRLAGDFDVHEARAMVSLSALCLRQSPILRPSANQILHFINHNVSSISFLFPSNKTTID